MPSERAGGRGADRQPRRAANSRGIHMPRPTRAVPGGLLRRERAEGRLPGAAWLRHAAAACALTDAGPGAAALRRITLRRDHRRRDASGQHDSGRRSQRHGPTLPPELCRAIIADANRHGLKASAHVSYGADAEELAGRHRWLRATGARRPWTTSSSRWCARGRGQIISWTMPCIARWNWRPTACHRPTRLPTSPAAPQKPRA